MKFYLRNDIPIRLKGQKPTPNDIEISETEYKKICKERNDQIAADQARQEEEMKPIRERNRLIQERMFKIAEQQLIDEGIITKEV